MLLEERAYTVLVGKIMALEILVETLWTNEFSKHDNPEKDARDFKKTVMNLIDHDEDSSTQVQAVYELKQRIASILERVRSL